MKSLAVLFAVLIASTFAEDEIDASKTVTKRGALYSGYGGYGYGHGYGYGYPVVSTAVVHTPVVAKSYYGGYGSGYYGGYGGYGGYGHYGLGHGYYYPAYSYSHFGLGHGLGYGYYGHGYGLW
ncbi:hypothetical protein QE152_g19182 [Popillia japonica]|uniref:Uncharacterized protein n=1 Tax=Popillia japonica TaxID=7064 RepID=A0AAW1L1M2_POPJA